MTHPVLLELERPIVELERRIQELETHPEPGAAVSGDLERLRQKAEALRQKIYGNLTPWQRVQILRHPSRPRPTDLVGSALTDVVELRGDRVTGEDPGLFAGLGYWDRQAVAFLGHGRGRSGTSGGPWVAPPTAAGYRKASRLVELAARFGLPLVTAVDSTSDGSDETAGPSMVELASLLTDLPTPSVSVLMGEAYGEASLLLALTDRVLALEHCLIAPLAPERVALLSLGDASRAQEAAAALRPTAENAREVGLADHILPEPQGGAHHHRTAAIAEIRAAVRRELQALGALPTETRVETRRARLQGITQLALGG